MLMPSPKIKLKNCPATVPVHAITANPKLDKLPFANRSAKVFPSASRVEESKALSYPLVIEIY